MDLDMIEKNREDVDYALCIHCGEEFNCCDMGYWDDKKKVHVQSFICISCSEK